MGRQAYRNRLALGRSPYEPPEPPVGAAADASGRVHRRTSAIHADGYVQHYDERGHPINPDSKNFGRELRRAKNDILSTMGIVVSDDRNASAPNEQQKIDTIAAENDYGLIMATFDQVAVFLSSWWTSSLTGRIQTFKSYTNVPLLELQTERNSSPYRSDLPQEEISRPTASPEELALQDHAEAAQSGSSGLNVSTQGHGQDADYNENRVLSGEDDPISQSPAELSTGFSLEAATLRGPTTIPSAVISSNPPVDTHPPFEQAQSRLNSRSDTLLSRQSSPATSPPTSPRVRASLIHQNSDVVTMQLEVLGNRNTRNPSPQHPRTANEIDRSDYNGAPADRRSIQDFLDNLLANQGQSLATVAGSEVVDSDGLSNMTTALSPETGDGSSSIPLHDQDHGQRTLDEQPTHGTPATQPVTTIANILPDSVEEPSHDDNLEPTSDADVLHAHVSNGELPPPLVDALVSGDMPADPSSVPHRVTILSCHPVDSLASHLASIITTALFIPLESYYLRSLASSYLSSVGSPRRSDVRPLGAWGGGGSSSDIMAYVGKMALMVGLQAALNASVWGVISGAAIRIGKRFCGWGNL
ncbi:hypothetical protein KXW98_008773 [Aspergillus fumigatus]|nr:hypothetical protein KXX10_000058 [Aspergillus fumigatus]KAH1507566.1 hypothetical protein KXX52_005277 [Aspergillus fumigatus]KAH1544312.1 hypothetical protein KXX61_003247 [Aspergillus fumigatus]KAH1608161.1 hypothetical protein KXX44_008059 [Aspergillus fumigatus]KAH1617754.1 hypothetical protein KXX21_009228 [Aspergillus fumigatus]